MRPFDEPARAVGDLGADTLAGLLSAASDLTLVVDSNGVVRDLALAAAEPIGDNLDSWIGRPWIDAVTVESRPKVKALQADAGTQPIRRHLNFTLPGGGELPVTCTVLRPTLLPNGHAAEPRLYVFGRDLRPMASLQQRLVEAQQAMERDYWRFRHAEARYRHLFQVANEAVLVIDAVTQKVQEANPAAARLLGDGAAHSLVGTPFPAGVDARSAEALNQLLAAVRATGRPDELRADLLDARGEVQVHVSSFRQERQTQFLVRIVPAAPDVQERHAPSTSSVLLKLVQTVPDCLVVTDLDGRVISANAAFVELAQMTSEEQARGEPLDRWLGRSGVDMSVMISNLRQRGALRLFATTLRGEFGAVTDVEISAAMVPHGDRPFLGFTIRDVGRRLSGEARGGRQLPRSVGQLTELVGRVPLKDIVGETTELIEQLCIEAALELTRDNRASAAEMLGLSRQSLYVKLRRYGLGDLASAEAPDTASAALRDEPKAERDGD
jgi:transcriptional regulator PpsR